MKTYLVGGAIRDQLLHRPVKEKDWVVVGATPASMLAAGYQQVGKDFPVFLHPQTKEEYALARKERKVAKGYHGFEFDVTASVTLEEDLLRRDLTINAMAQDDNGQLIDPYHGIDDLHKKILRHVSPAFVEDPVRILRVARFAARLPEFSVAEQTNDLMKKMVQQGEVNALVSERVWKEFEKAISEIAPWRFIEVLSDCGALSILFPIFDHKKNAVISCLKKISGTSSDAFERTVLMMQSTHAFTEIMDLCEHYRVPKPVSDMVQLVMKYQHVYENIIEKSVTDLLDLLISLDAFRRQDRFKQWLRLCEITSDQPNCSNYLLSALSQLNKIALPQQLLKKNSGKEIEKYIYSQRLAKLNEFIQSLKSNFD